MRWRPFKKDMARIRLNCGKNHVAVQQSSKKALQLNPNLKKKRPSQQKVLHLMILETDRLILRPIDPERDFEHWADTFSDAETMRYIGGTPLNRALAWRNMAMVNGHWALHGFGFFALEEKATGKFVGRAGPWFPEGWPQLEVGWHSAPNRLPHSTRSCRHRPG